MQELDELLALPLQEAFSRRFFTGVPSASLAAQGLPKGRAGARVPTSAGAHAATGAAGATAAADEPVAAATDAEPAAAAPAAEAVPDVSEQAQEQQAQRGLARTVALAQNLAASRQHAKVRRAEPLHASAWTCRHVHSAGSDVQAPQRKQSTHDGCRWCLLSCEGLLQHPSSQT